MTIDPIQTNSRLAIFGTGEFQRQNNRILAKSRALYAEDPDLTPYQALDQAKAWDAANPENGE